MSELRELYQSVILDHNNKPRNFGALDAANHRAEGHNPLCGDDVTVHLWVRRKDIDNGKSATVFTSPRGGMALTRYYDDQTGRPFVDTPALLRLAIGLPD